MTTPAENGYRLCARLTSPLAAININDHNTQEYGERYAVQSTVKAIQFDESVTETLQPAFVALNTRGSGFTSELHMTSARARELAALLLRAAELADHQNDQGATAIPARQLPVGQV